MVLGNLGEPEDVDVLTRALDDPEPLVREHAASALRRLGTTGAAQPVCADTPGDAVR